eukprot:3943009-Ditylum_brightwellii.AAC.1
MANNIRSLSNKELNFVSEKSNDTMIVECYIDNKEGVVLPHTCPLSFKLIQNEQQKDKLFLAAIK